MAIEKFIRGKRDSCHHDGLVSIRRREQQADYHLKHWQEEAEPIPEIPMVHGGSLRILRGGKEHILYQEGGLPSLREEGLLNEIPQRQRTDSIDSGNA